MIFCKRVYDEVAESDGYWLTGCGRAELKKPI